jgi:DNA polymerase family A
VLERLPFRHVVAVDFEFHFGGHATLAAAGVSGERLQPVCMCAKDLRTGQVWRLWYDKLGHRPPFPVDRDTLVLAYYSSAELGCFRALGWRQPDHVLDLFTEFRARTNGRGLPNGSGLLGALTYFGIDGIDVTEKRDLQTKIVSSGPWDADDRAAILDYCWSDVVALERLLSAMLPQIDAMRALYRGQFMKAAAAIEWAGVPIDYETLELLRHYWLDIQDDLIADIDRDYGVFEGRSFRLEKWANYLCAHNIPWPTTETGQLSLSDDTFRQMAKSYPAVSPMRELRSALAEMRLSDLAVSRTDHRNRTLLSAFRSRTGRCQPSNTKYIFGPSVWLRSLIKPQEGYGVAYIDWEQQEHGIAAALSGDSAMQAAYVSGDPYLEFAKQAGAVPSDAIREDYEGVRELFKQCVLAVAYGMEAPSLAGRIGKPEIIARDLLRAHRETYRRFWAWSDAAVDYAVLNGTLHTVFGWPIHVGEGFNPRSLRNFPMQGNGAEMLRLACCYATEAGIEVCAPVHDAVLVAAPLDHLDHDVARMRACMAKASRDVLDGFELRTEAKSIRFPARYSDRRGRVMWQRVMQLITTREGAKQDVA